MDPQIQRVSAVIFSCLLVLIPVTGHADEAAIRAAFVLNFARFTSWPTGAFVDAQSKLSLCVPEQYPGAGRLLELEGKKAAERILTVRTFSQSDALEGCHIVYLVGLERRPIQRALVAVGARPVLTIGEMNGFGDMGGVINLVVIDGKLRFKINRQLAERVGLRLSSQLLKLALSTD
jgi:hypothetical protein